MSPANGTGLQRRQDSPGRSSQARAPTGRLPHQLDGRCLRHSHRRCPQHFRRSSWAPLSFLSKKLSPAETRYSAFDRELLAVYSTINHFYLMLAAVAFGCTSWSSLKIFDTFLELTTLPPTLSLVLLSFHASPPLTCHLSLTPRHSPSHR